MRLLLLVALLWRTYGANVPSEVATKVEESCPDLHVFVYTCAFQKHPVEAELLGQDYLFCCQLRAACDGAGKECRDRFCECLDLVNLAHGSRHDQCRSGRLPTCIDTLSPFARGVNNELKDVIFVRTRDRNILLGPGGLVFAVLMLICSAAAGGYLTYVCVKDRCFRRPQPLDIEESTREQPEMLPLPVEQLRNSGVESPPPTPTATPRLEATNTTEHPV